LVEELVEHRCKVVRQPDEAARTEWRRVVDFAKRHQMLPAGSRVEKSGTRTGDLRIQLLDGLHPNTRGGAAGGLAVVPMPSELRSVHPVVVALQNDRGRLVMPGSLRQRCLLYLHGLTREAVCRGYVVREQPVALRYRGKITTYGRPGQPDYSRREGELDLVVDGLSCTVEIAEKHPQAVDERWERLVVTLHPAYLSRERQYRWADGVRNRIEDSVVAVLGEVERRAIEARVEREQRSVAWRAAMQRATLLATHAHRVAVVARQAADWRHVQELGLYCDALESRICEAERLGLVVEGARRWLRWAHEYAAGMDPLRNLPVMPVFDPGPADLEPFLDGWSAYEPERAPSRLGG
jgi:hypothetical protein